MRPTPKDLLAVAAAGGSQGAVGPPSGGGWPQALLCDSVACEPIGAWGGPPAEGTAMRGSFQSLHVYTKSSSACLRCCGDVVST